MGSLKKLKVLLVEDEEDLRSVIELFFGETFEVTSVGTAREATQIIESGVSIDLLMVDFHLKGPDQTDQKDGLDVTNVMRSRYPLAPVLLSSGSGPEENPRIRELLALPNTQFLQKPFNSATLKKVIRLMELPNPT
jgi:CheY-like chemotaxis protein